MNEFLNNSTIIFKNIGRLKEIIEEMEKYTLLKQNSVLDESKEAALENKIEKSDFNFNSISETIKDEIKRNQDEVDRLKKNGISKREMEIRRSHLFKQSKDLAEAIASYRNLKCEYKNKERELLQRAYQIVNPSGDKFEYREVEKDTSSKAVFAVGSKSSQEIIRHANNRKLKIDKIVETITKLAGMIDEIDEIVHKNSKVVDDILGNITDAEMNSAEANRELESALAYQRKVNYIKRLLLKFLIFFIFILIIWLYIQYRIRLSYYYYRYLRSY